MNINKYIGIPFQNHGRDIKTGVDCFGLVIEVLKNEFGIKLPDWISEECNFGGFKKIDEPVLGSIGLFKFAGVPAHVGVYAGDDRILHVAPGETSVAEKLSSRRLKGRLNGWYSVE